MAFFEFIFSGKYAMFGVIQPLDGPGSALGGFLLLPLLLSWFLRQIPVHHRLRLARSHCHLLRIGGSSKNCRPSPVGPRAWDGIKEASWISKQEEGASLVHCIFDWETLT